MTTQSAGPADSAGQPWTGRTLPDGGFAGDSGATDPALGAVLAAPRDEPALVAAVAAARLLVCVTAHPAEVEVVDGQTVEKQTDMALVTLVAPDGQRALPAFTGVAALAAWDPQARPVPVTAARAAQSAVAEGCSVIVLDLGSEHEVVLRPSMVWALAQQREWLPAHQDPFVAAGVGRAVAVEEAVRGHQLAAGQPEGSGALAVVLDLAPGLTRDEVAAIASRVGERLATDGELRARIDALAFTVR